MAALTKSPGTEREARTQNSVILPILLGLLLLVVVGALLAAHACG